MASSLSADSSIAYTGIIPEPCALFSQVYRLELAPEILTLSFLISADLKFFVAEPGDISELLPPWRLELPFIKVAGLVDI